MWNKYLADAIVAEAQLQAAYPYLEQIADEAREAFGFRHPVAFDAAELVRWCSGRICHEIESQRIAKIKLRGTPVNAKGVKMPRFPYDAPVGHKRAVRVSWAACQNDGYGNFAGK